MIQYPEADILVEKKENMERTKKLLKKYGFLITATSYELGFPAITIKTTWDALINTSRRLLDTLDNRHIVVRHHSEEVWTPQIHAIYDPSSNDAIIMLYGVDDDLIADFN